MDALGGLLNGPRAQQPMVMRMVMAAPWAIRIKDTAPLTVVAAVEGIAHVRYDDGESAALSPGDVALFRGTHPYVIADDPGSDVIALIDESGDCFDPTGRHAVAEQMCLGIRSWGNVGIAAASADSAPAVSNSTLLIGAYQSGEIGRSLLETLDRMTIVDMRGDPLVAMMAVEMLREAPAQDAVLNRVLDLLLISCLRRAMESDSAPAWYRAHADPVVGHALRLLHNNIDERWTVQSLAAQVGVSRAVLARRFTELVGEPPMSYLTSWRLSTAADLLADGDETLTSIARRVGYGTAFALSTAFKRERGVSPAEFRRTRIG
ncbi:AraC family transcriptional regulator [Gordonia sinesedis]